MLFDRVTPDLYDYNTLPGFEKLTETQRLHIHKAYETEYLSAKHLGVKVATGRGYEAAKLAIEQEMRPALVIQSVPPSIFAGLDNCK